MAHLSRKVPYNVIVHVLNKVHILGHGPKVKELRKVSHGKVFIQLDLSNQRILLQDLTHIPRFALEMVKMRGAMSLGFLPPSQGASQKGVFSPLPMVMVVEA
jgi:predicted nucleic acid-binding Zn finger protein